MCGVFSSSAQGDAERAVGLAVSPTMDCNRPIIAPQFACIVHVVLPLFEQLAEAWKWRANTVHAAPRVEQSVLCRTHASGQIDAATGTEGILYRCRSCSQYRDGTQQEHRRSSLDHQLARDGARAAESGASPNRRYRYRPLL